ncbi:hypothetical protein HYPSUDRAFT_35802 [Hypholoma sublateritium FD-334 SS-4]|uniref:ABC transporter domain-containing protein n=1 Tax=Hypholoma sublateritium (strain FD-334 SS-4) TaxID=945553 RepID=A0A0D2LHX4_HYPSF|nr:hypothetical protein HYPSUDRAFT_35802 [Hypholoma sublateritium FD-334 SS-4]
MSKVVLELMKISCSLEKGVDIFTDVNLSVNEGDVLVLQGRSGSGKSTLLKCIANLAAHSGDIVFHGKTPQECRGRVPGYRTRVMYVPQRPSLLPDTPSDFLSAVSRLQSRQASAQEKGENRTEHILKRAVSVGRAWGIPPELWTRDWMKLSGGEGQRILIAAALSLNTAEVLLLDEPTSALDAETSLQVEDFILDKIQSAEESLKAVIWITHSAEQSKRVGTRFLNLSAGSCFETDDYNPPLSAFPTTVKGKGM